VQLNAERTIQLLGQRLADAEMRECMLQAYTEDLEKRLQEANSELDRRNDEAQARDTNAAQTLFP
jgi:hypothetical protein